MEYWWFVNFSFVLLKLNSFILCSHSSRFTSEYLQISEHYAESANRKINKTSVLSCKSSHLERGSSRALEGVCDSTPQTGKARVRSQKAIGSCQGKGVVWTRENHPAEQEMWQRYGESSVRWSFPGSPERRGRCRCTGVSTQRRVQTGQRCDQIWFWKNLFKQLLIAPGYRVSGSLSQSGWLKQQKLFSRSPAGCRPEIKVEAGLVSSGVSLFVMPMATPTYRVLMWYFVSGLYILVSFPLMRTLGI